MEVAEFDPANSSCQILGFWQWKQTAFHNPNARHYNENKEHSLDPSYGYHLAEDLYMVFWLWEDPWDLSMAHQEHHPDDFACLS